MIRSASPPILQTKPDSARCLERIEAWFHQAVIDRPPIRFYKHNAQFDAGEPLDRTRWSSLEQRVVEFAGTPQRHISRS